MAILSGLSGLGEKIMTQIIGVDFDNTIVSYDDLIHRIAVDKYLVPPDTLKSKKQVRDCIRRINAGCDLINLPQNLLRRYLRCLNFFSSVCSDKLKSNEKKMKSKIISFGNLRKRIHSYQKNNKKVVMCYGMFGVLHIGIVN